MIARALAGRFADTRRLAIRAQAGRGLRQHSEEGGIGVAQSLGRFAEIGPAGRLNTFQHATHGRVIDVDGEDFILAVASLQLQGAQNLLALAGQ